MLDVGQHRLVVLSLGLKAQIASIAGSCEGTAVTVMGNRLRHDLLPRAELFLTLVFNESGSHILGLLEPVIANEPLVIDKHHNLLCGVNVAASNAAGEH
jgi:hypothetical protein